MQTVTTGQRPLFTLTLVQTSRSVYLSFAIGLVRLSRLSNVGLFVILV
jgi:hypothetical protein